MAEKKEVTIPNIREKLAAVQDELIAPKGQRNDFGKYNYRSCEDILKALKPILKKYGCMVYMDNDIVLIGERYYAVATVTFQDIASGSIITNKAQAREEDTKKGMDGSQITGASISYARKYALAGLFDIDNEKDSDATNHGGAEPVYPEPMSKSTQKATPEQIQLIFNELNRSGIPQAQVIERYRLKTITDITADQAMETIRELKTLPDYKR